MTTQQCVDLFNVLIDKYGSPNVIDSEIKDLLDMAAYEYLNRLVPDTQGGIANYEFDSNVVHNIKPLIYTLTLNTTSGLLADATIEAALSGDPMFRVMSAGITTDGITYPVKYEFQNTLHTNGRNYFKAPSATNPRYTITNEGLKFYPTNDADDITLTVIKTPASFSDGDPEFSDYVLFNIIAIAVKISGVPLREEEILTDARNSGVQMLQ